MIKVSTKGRYGMRLMLELAIANGSQPLSLSTIAKKQDISYKYLWKVIPPLKSAELIKSVQGAKGGYTLAKPASKISLEDILTALEGPLSLTECVRLPKECKRSSVCITREIWVDLSERLSHMLNSITLKDLADGLTARQ